MLEVCWGDGALENGIVGLKGRQGRKLEMAVTEVKAGLCEQEEAYQKYKMHLFGIRNED